MKGALPLVLALALAGCGGEDDVPAADNAAGTTAAASAPILGRAEIANDMAKEKLSDSAPPVPRGTGAPAPEPALKEVEGYRAIGTEPFWAVTVHGSAATLQRPDKPPMRFAVERREDRRTIRYLGEGFSMTVGEGPCSDGMSDAIWSDRVQVAFGEGTLKGCGGERDDREADGL